MPKKLTKSARYALEGLLHVFKTQRNIRLHMYVATLVIGLALLFCTYIELLILILTVFIVLIAETLNTSAEYMVDLLSKQYHSTAKTIKDITAGAVLLSVINAVVVGTIIAVRHYPYALGENIKYIHETPWLVGIIALIASFVVAAYTKVMLARKPKAFTGGMPSVHAALAFSIWTITLFLSDSAVMIAIIFALSVYIGYSRVVRKIHSVLQVVSGGLMGIGVTALVFYVVRLLCIGC